MSRDDSLLYSGGSSHTPGASVRDQRDERLRKKEEERFKLMPAADVIQGEIARERAKIAAEVLSYVTSDTEVDNLKAVLLSLRMYDKKLTQFSKRIDNIMREPMPSMRKRALARHATVEEAVDAGL